MAIPRALTLIAGAAPLVLTACGQAPGAAGSGPAIAVAATETSCQVERTDLPAGQVTFAVANKGSSVNELYVYGQDGSSYTRIVGEVENIGPGTSKNLTVSLPAGTYEAACKPGQTGAGIRTRLTVSGGPAGSPSSSPAAAGYDREIALTTDGTALTGLSGAARAGERIEFVLTNHAAAPRTLELKKPSGAVAGEVAVDPGATGKIVVALDIAGTWQVVVEGAGVADVTAQLPVT